MEKPNIVILGAGYGGLMTTVTLQKKLGIDQANITLVNKNDYHYQSTWLHESSAGTLAPERVSIQIKDLLKTNRVNFIQDSVVKIAPDEKKVQLENSEISYDILVVGLGFEGATFGIKGLEENALMISNLDASLLIREHIEYNFAMYQNEEVKNQARLNIVVGGAGFTGMEFVGEIANRVPELCKEYNIDRSLVKIITVEGAPTVMPGFDPQLVEYAMNSLEGRGVEFVTGAMLKEVRPDGVTYEKNGEEIDVPTLNTIWAAGVKANSIVEESGFETNRGKVEVRPDMRAPDYDDVFVVGDCALIMNPEAGRPYPPTAQMAVQMAHAAGQNIKLMVEGNKNLEPIQPQILGTVASLGNNDAIGTILNDRKIFGWKATVMKKIIDNKYLFQLGGIVLLLKKGKFNIFNI